MSPSSSVRMWDRHVRIECLASTLAESRDGRFQLPVEQRQKTDVDTSSCYPVCFRDGINGSWFCLRTNSVFTETCSEQKV